jgi:acetolactate synthase-1/2/3 large subunit
MGAKLAEPTKLCVNWMGDAAFGMTGLDLETATRARLPILTIVLKNSTMAIERHSLTISHEKQGSRDLGGEYFEIAWSLAHMRNGWMIPRL